MELKYPFLLILGIAIAGALGLLFVVLSLKKESAGKGIRIANMDLYKDDPYVQRSYIFYVISRFILVAALIGCVVMSFILLARPYYYKKINEEKHNRDIMICLDISSSVDDLNLKLCKELQDTVRSLSGERIGIVMFNTSPVLLSPLSDDYEYTTQQLENIRKAISVINKTQVYTGSDWAYWQNFLYGGTLVGNYERGSSLIGDGLLGGLFNFPKDSDKRTKVIIFATDNDKNGEGYVNLTEAAEYCKKNDVTVYGIGTKLMYSQDKEEMKKAMELTGGKFYLEEDAKTFSSIVDEIESMSASLVRGKVVIKEVESPEKFFKWLVILFAVVVIFSILLRRVNIPTVITLILTASMLLLTYKFCVQAATKRQMGPELSVNKSAKYNVLFVIDDTLSMVADDGRSGNTRLDDVKEDCKYIVSELEGAKFSVITFNNDAMILSPFNSSIQHIENVIDSVYPLQEFYARGSTMNTPKKTILSVLDKTDDKTAVFYFGDGENTNTDKPLESYSELKDKIDDGAVLGYGTSQGGTMSIKSSYDNTYETVMDYYTYPFGPAISRIDEGNLKAMANDMGVKYINANGAGLENVVSNIKSKLDIKEEVEKKDDGGNDYVSVPENNWYYLFLVCAILMIADTIYVIKKK